MKNKIVYIILAVTVIFTAAAMNFLPDSVPMHFDLEGTADRYGSKFEMFLFPAAMFIIIVIFEIIRNVQRKNAEKIGTDEAMVKFKANDNVMLIAIIISELILPVMEIVCMKSSLDVMNFPDDSEASLNGSMTMLTVIFGILFIILGNIMPKTKRNGYVGLRTSWTLADDTVWQKSNRFGGAALAAGGVISIVLGFIVKGIASVLAMLAILMIAAGVSVWYSYKVSKEK